jgi:hypothetical protein
MYKIYNYVHNLNSSKEFIGLVYMIDTWIVKHSHLHDGETEKLVAAQSKKLDVSERGTPM